MLALVLDADKRTAIVSTRSQPKPGPNELLIRVHAIALNPIDALYVFNPIGATGRVIGSDFAGTIETCGEASSSAFPPNSRVAGFLQGACSANERPGAFAEWVICPQDLVWKIPDSVSFESAATISLCALTAAQALHYRLHLPAPFQWKTPTLSDQYPGHFTASAPLEILVYGASTSVGLYAAQLIRASAEVHSLPIRLIGTASKARFDMLRNAPFSYDGLVDYRGKDWPTQVQRLTKGRGINLAIDCISEGPTVRMISKILAKDGRIAVVRSRAYGAWETDGILDDVDPIYGAVWEGLGEEVEYNDAKLAASPAAREFAVAFYNWLSQSKSIEPNPTRKMPGGLENVVSDGLALLGAGSMEDRGRGRAEEYMKPVSAEKLVYGLL